MEHPDFGFGRGPFFAGVLSAETLRDIEENPLGDLSRAAGLCTALEIRYDLLLSAGCPEGSLGSVAERVRSLFPKALLIGTIRLVRDGGTFPDEEALSRAKYFVRILSENVVPDYLDVEAEEFAGFVPQIEELWKSDERRKDTAVPLLSEFPKKVLVSHHDFQKVPSEEELEKILGVARGPEGRSPLCGGLKIACMSTSAGDFDRVYPWIRAVKRNVSPELFSCFAMGKTGEDSRIRSLLSGANLTYCSLGRAVAPGQIPVERAETAYRELLSQAENVESSGKTVKNGGFDL